MKTDHGDYNPLENLKVLCTNLDLNDIRQAILVPFIFRVATHLCNLQIVSNEVGQKNASENSQLPYPEHKYWKEKQLDSISNHLRAVQIAGFTGTEREMRLVSHLIRNGTMLDQAVVHCSDDCSRQGRIATMGLLSLPIGLLSMSISMLPRTLIVPVRGTETET
ncbi:unnamed protein product [Camellia sinensis]